MQKFLEHFAGIAVAFATVGVWDDQDGLFYDRILLPDGNAVPIRVRSMVSMIPPLAAAVINEEAVDQSLVTGKRFADYLRRHGMESTDDMIAAGILPGDPGKRWLLVGVTSLDRVPRLCRKLFDPGEFLSPHGLWSLSAYHRVHRYALDIDGVRAGFYYEPAESTNAMFGGNSNWPGPVSFPLHYLVVTALECYDEFFGNDLTIGHPPYRRRLRHVAATGVLSDPQGARACVGGVQRLQTDPRCLANLQFHENFHPNNGAGLGASHQTGRMGSVPDVILCRHRVVPLGV